MMWAFLAVIAGNGNGSGEGSPSAQDSPVARIARRGRVGQRVWTTLARTASDVWSYALGASSARLGIALVKARPAR